MENLYDKRIKARRGAVWLKVLWIILCSFIYFWVAELITLIIYQYAEFGFTTRNTHRVYRFLMKIKEEPDFVFTAYGLWFKGLLNTDVYSWGRFIPLLVPLLFLFIIFPFKKTGYYVICCPRAPERHLPDAAVLPYGEALRKNCPVQDSAPG